MRIWRIETLWLALACVLLLLAVWWFPGAGNTNFDSYSVAFAGKKAFYQILQRLESDVSRNTKQLIPSTRLHDRLLILGPARYPSADEWSALHDAVLGGATLIFAASSRDPQLDAGPFAATVQPLHSEWSEPSTEFGDNSSRKDNGKAADDSTQNRAGTDVSARFPESLDESIAETALVNTKVTWRTQARIETNAPDWQVLVSVDEQPQVVRRRLRMGTVVLVASDAIFNNASMAEPQQALLAYRIVESAPTQGRTWIDETLNRSGVPKVLGILFDPIFRPMTLQLLLIAVLFGWSGSRRFGPAKQSTQSRRRSIVEHAQAVGSLYFRAGAGSHAVLSLHEFLKLELRTLYGATIHVDDSAVVSRLVHADEAEVQKLFEQVDAASKGELSRVSAGNLLRLLALLISRVRAES